MVTFDRLTAGLVFVAIAVLACLAPAQGDTWWHLRAGLDIWRTHHVPLVDAYSFTAPGAPFPDHGWLSEVLFSGLEQAGGMPLLVAGAGCAIVGAWFLSWRLADGPFEVRLVTLLAGVSASTVSWAVRPQVLSMVALMLTCMLLVRGQGRLLPLLFIAWANVHGAVLLGLVAIAAALVTTTLDRRRVPVELTLIGVACGLTTLCTPMGLRFWPEILRSLGRSNANALIEWSAPGFSTVMWPFWGLAAALPIAAVRFRRRLEGRVLILVSIALALLPLAVRSVRNVGMFTLVAAPALTVLMRKPEEASVPVRRKAAHERTKLNAVILTAAALAGSVIVAELWETDAPMLGWHPLSQAAIRTVASCPDPLYNTFENGGALIWFVPEKRVFIDSRQDPYPAELLSTARQVESDGRYRALFAEYGIRCAVVPTTSPTAGGLNRDGAWTRAYADARWSIFTRP